MNSTKIVLALTLLLSASLSAMAQQPQRNPAANTQERVFEATREARGMTVSDAEANASSRACEDAEAQARAAGFGDCNASEAGGSQTLSTWWENGGGFGSQNRCSMNCYKRTADQNNYCVVQTRTKRFLFIRKTTYAAVLKKYTGLGNWGGGVIAETYDYVDLQSGLENYAQARAVAEDAVSKGWCRLGE